jgi:hypothetical protein
MIFIWLPSWPISIQLCQFLNSLILPKVHLQCQRLRSISAFRRQLLLSNVASSSGGKVSSGLARASIPAKMISWLLQCRIRLGNVR